MQEPDSADHDLVIRATLGLPPARSGPPPRITRRRFGSEAEASAWLSAVVLGHAENLAARYDLRSEALHDIGLQLAEQTRGSNWTYGGLDFFVGLDPWFPVVFTEDQKQYAVVLTDGQDPDGGIEVGVRSPTGFQRARCVRAADKPVWLFQKPYKTEYLEGTPAEWNGHAAPGTLVPEPVRRAAENGWRHRRTDEADHEADKRILRHRQLPIEVRRAAFRRFNRRAARGIASAAPHLAGVQSDLSSQSANPRSIPAAPWPSTDLHLP